MRKLRNATLILYLFIFQFTTLYANERVFENETADDPAAYTDTLDADEVNESANEAADEAGGLDEASFNDDAPLDEITNEITNEITETDDTQGTQIPERVESESAEPEPMEPDFMTEDLPLPPEIVAASAVMIDAETGLVLYAKEKDVRSYPASVTKVLTALLTLELCEDLDESITFSPEAVFSLPRDASHIAMDEGETLTLIDALHGLLIASANEVANALAEYIAGSNAEFAALMNLRAESLGAANTHFDNPSGLFSAEHYTTAYDMALIMREAVKQPVFTEIIAKRRYDIAPTEKQENVRELLNTNKLIQPGTYFNEWVIGGKTGYTDEAQHTLATYAEKDGRSLITVVMMDERLAAFSDTNALLDYGFALAYEEALIFDSSAYKRVLPVYVTEGGVRTQAGEVILKGTRDVSVWLPAGFDKSDLRYELSTPDELTPPVRTGDLIGSVACYAGDVLIGEVKLKATNAVFLPEPVREPEPEPEVENAIETAQAPESEALDTTATEINGENFLTTLLVPIAFSLTALVISIVLFLIRRKHRRAKIIHFDRYSRYGSGNAYHYRS